MDTPAKECISVLGTLNSRIKGKRVLYRFPVWEHQNTDGECFEIHQGGMLDNFNVLYANSTCLS